MVLASARSNKVRAARHEQPCYERTPARRPLSALIVRRLDMRTRLVIVASFVLLAGQPARADPAPCSFEDPRPITAGVRLRLEPSQDGASLECLNGSESQRHLELLKAGLAARWKIPLGIEPFPSLVANLRFDASAVTMAEIVETTDRKLVECLRNALADLSAALSPVPKCLVGTAVRARLLIPWKGAPDDLFSSAPSPQEKDRLRELGYIE